MTATKGLLNHLYRNNTLLNMTFTDKQMSEAIAKNEDVRNCFSKITDACMELKSKTGCPDDDVDRFLEFAIGKWSNLEN
tara:strand:- start:543 stop:779 length:237 start_codon:yes stop_codon:yes gene_type:complete